MSVHDDLVCEACAHTVFTVQCGRPAPTGSFSPPQNRAIKVGAGAGRSQGRLSLRSLTPGLAESSVPVLQLIDMAGLQPYKGRWRGNCMNRHHEVRR